jgi:hypothetical protein
MQKIASQQILMHPVNYDFTAGIARGAGTSLSLPIGSSSLNAYGRGWVTQPCAAGDC